jgi:hypothetical protein
MPIRALTYLWGGVQLDAPDDYKGNAVTLSVRIASEAAHMYNLLKKYVENNTGAINDPRFHEAVKIIDNVEKFYAD